MGGYLGCGFRSEWLFVGGSGGVVGELVAVEQAIGSSMVMYGLGW
jgi:hypothetical protein